MKYRPARIVSAAIVAVLSCVSQISTQAQIAQIATPLGNIYVELTPDAAPGTVTNFLKYLSDGDYENSVIHRTARISNAGVDVIQGGGFTLENTGVVADLADGSTKNTLSQQGLIHYGEFNAIPTDPPIANEFNQSNLRGTIAMARLGGNPNSATSQWFINLSDTNSVLDTSDGDGFTVFGNVVAGLEVADAIYNLTDVVVGSPSNTQLFPLTNTPILASAAPPSLEQEEAVLTHITLIIPGDTDGDGDIDDTDLGVMISNFNGPDGTGKTLATGDTDFDRDVDDTDLGVAISGFTGPNAAAVPEPTSAGLLLISGLAFMRGRLR